MTNSKRPPGAVRMKRLRDRRKRSAVMVNLELSKAGIDRMVEKGWLRSEQRHDRQAVTQAVLDVGAAALWPG